MKFCAIISISILKTIKVLISGITGQDDSYLAELLLEKGVSVRRPTCFPRCADYGQFLGCYLLKAASSDGGGAVRTKSMSWSGSSLNLA